MKDRRSREEEELLDLRGGGEGEEEGGDRARIDTDTVARFGSPVHRLLCLNISGAGFMDRD